MANKSVHAQVYYLRFHIGAKGAGQAQMTFILFG